MIPVAVWGLLCAWLYWVLDLDLYSAWTIFAQFCIGAGRVQCNFVLKKEWSLQFVILLCLKNG